VVQMFRDGRTLFVDCVQVRGTVATNLLGFGSKSDAQPAEEHMHHHDTGWSTPKPRPGRGAHYSPNWRGHRVEEVHQRGGPWLLPCLHLLCSQAVGISHGTPPEGDLSSTLQPTPKMRPTEMLPVHPEEGLSSSPGDPPKVALLNCDGADLTEIGHHPKAHNQTSTVPLQGHCRPKPNSPRLVYPLLMSQYILLYELHRTLLLEKAHQP